MAWWWPGFTVETMSPDKMVRKLCVLVVIEKNIYIMIVTQTGMLAKVKVKQSHYRPGVAQEVPGS